MVKRVLYEDDLTKQLSEDSFITANNLNSVFTQNYIVLVAGENIGIGDPCIIKSDGKVYRSRANNLNLMPCSVISKNNLVAGQEGEFLLAGELQNINFNSSDVGKIVYVGLNGGLATQYSYLDSLVQPVGLIKNSNTLLVNIGTIIWQRFIDVLVVFNGSVNVGANAFVSITSTSYNRDSYKFFGHKYKVIFQVFGSISNSNVIGEVRLYDVIRNLVVGSVIINQIDQVVRLDVTNQIVESGIMIIECQAKRVSGNGNLIIKNVLLETEVGENVIV